MSSPRLCPNCGVAVPQGYPSCPRCQAALAASPRAPGRMRSHLWRAGGTSVAGSRRVQIALFAIASVIAAVVGVVVLLAVTDGGEPEPAIEPELSDEAADPAAGDREPELAALPPSPQRATPQTRLDDARQNLETALSGQRLWSTVTMDSAEPGVVVIRSSLCEDAGMKQVIGKNAAALKASGVAAVRCVAQHGGVIFEQAL